MNISLMDVSIVPHQKWSLIYDELDKCQRKTLQRLDDPRDYSSKNSRWNFKRLP